MDKHLHDTTDDNALVLAVRNGDGKAFEELFARYYSRLCRYAATYLDSPAEAEDVVQEMFVCLWDNRRSLCIDTSLEAYLFSAVRHRALNVLKHQAVELHHSPLLVEFYEDLARTGYSEEEERQIEMLHRILRGLPEQCRIVFTKSCLEGKKYKEIAEELGISVHTVKYHITHAYTQIRSQLPTLGNLPILLWICCRRFLSREVPLLV